MRKALTIAGSDSSGGAGIQADLKTFSANGVFGMSVVTAVTAQNTQGVFAVEDISPMLIQKQIEAIFDDIEVDALKIGMVSNIETIDAIGDSLRRYSPESIVVDPVMISKSGCNLLQPEAKDALIGVLLPFSTVVTPNIPEAEVLTGMKIENTKDMVKAAEEILKMGPQYVLIKGGHGIGDANDILLGKTGLSHLSAKRIDTKNTHGTGCTLSAAIASNLAKGLSVENAVKDAKAYITMAIKHSFSIGKGVGPTNHFYQLYEKAGMNNE